MAIGIIEDKRYQPNFEYYIKAKKLNVGDAWVSYEFIFWIDNMHTKFQKERYGEFYFTTKKEAKDYYTAFHKWLDEEIEREAHHEKKD